MELFVIFKYSETIMTVPNVVEVNVEIQASNNVVTHQDIALNVGALNVERQSHLNIGNNGIASSSFKHQGVSELFSSSSSHSQSIGSNGLHTSHAQSASIGGVEFSTDSSTSVSANGMEVSKHWNVAGYECGIDLKCCDSMPNFGCGDMCNSVASGVANIALSCCSFFKETRCPSVPDVNCGAVSDVVSACASVASKAVDCLSSVGKGLSEVVSCAVKVLK